MRSKLINTTAAVLLLTASVSAQAEIGKDKYMHFGVSAVIGSAAQVVIKDPYKSFALCMSAGLAKELYDQYDYGGFSGADLVADGIGCGVSVMGVKYIQGYSDNDAVGVGVNFKF